jgi:hypothetical protein
MAAVQLGLLLLLLWGARGALLRRILHRLCSRWVAALRQQQQLQHKALLVLVVVLAMHGSLSALEKQQLCSNSSSSMLMLLLLHHMLEQLAPQQQQAMRCSCQAQTMSTLSWVQTLGSALAQASTAGLLAQAAPRALVGQTATETGHSSCTAAARCRSSSICSSRMRIMHWGQILLLVLGLAAWLAGLQRLVAEVCELPLTCMRLHLGAATPPREWQHCSFTNSSSNSRLGFGSHTIDGAARMQELAGVRIRTQQCPVSIGQVLAVLLLLLVEACLTQVAAES